MTKGAGRGALLSMPAGMGLVRQQSDGTQTCRQTYMKTMTYHLPAHTTAMPTIHHHLHLLGCGWDVVAHFYKGTTVSSFVGSYAGVFSVVVVVLREL